MKAQKILMNFGVTLIVNNMEEEIWKDIEGYCGRYSISNFGRIRSNFRFKNKIKNNDVIYLKLQTNVNGYYANNLYDNEVNTKMRTIHRLVANAFIPNPNNLPCINHIDGNKLNNRVDNLEWCTYSRNNKHAYDVGLKSASNREKNGCNSVFSKKIYQLTPDGIFIKEWDSLATVEKETGFHKSYICRCANFEKHCLTANGYRWIYKEDFNKLFNC